MAFKMDQFRIVKYESVFLIRRYFMHQSSGAVCIHRRIFRSPLPTDRSPNLKGDIAHLERLKGVALATPIFRHWNAELLTVVEVFKGRLDAPLNLFFRGHSIKVSLPRSKHLRHLQFSAGTPVLSSAPQNSFRHSRRIF